MKKSWPILLKKPEGTTNIKSTIEIQQYMI